jgi:uncharacterized protein (DUF433 family)
MQPTAHIEITPGTCGGKPRIAGTRIRVQDVLLLTEQGLTPYDLVERYPHLTLADVHAALAFYFDNADAINRQIAEDDEFVRKFREDYERRQHPPAATPPHGHPLSPG